MAVKTKQTVESIKSSRKKRIKFNFRRKEKIGVTLRSPESERLYKVCKKIGATNPLVSEPRLKEWKYWALIENGFPYDGVYRTSHMLIPKRVVTEDKLSTEENKELKKILEEVKDDYDCRLVNFSKNQSIKHHFHIHLLSYHRSRKDMKL